MTYLDGRRKYNRPQAMAWSDNASATDANGFLIPSGNEVGSSATGGHDFLILSDHNRDVIELSTNRLEKRDRMVNGRMRSWHIADKKSVSVGWNMLPSRAYEDYPGFNSTTGESSLSLDQEYTVDGGAGGMELLDWYNRHTGSFYVFLSYDKFNPLNVSDRNHVRKYNEVIEMYITKFDYSVIKRSGLDYDYWNVSVTLEEV